VRNTLRNGTGEEGTEMGRDYSRRRACGKQGKVLVAVREELVGGGEFGGGVVEAENA
jgi:hypothetical protein